MLYIDVNEQAKRLAFAKEAREAFKEHPEWLTWSGKHGQITPGCLFGVRWGADKDCVLVFRLDEAEKVELYTNLDASESTGDIHDQGH